MPRHVGRPLKITPEIQADLIKMLSAGNYLETAAAYCGISTDTVRGWVKRGEQEAQRLKADSTAWPIKSETEFMELAIAIRQAQATSEIRDVMLIGNAARDQWQAAAWRLERRYPDKWGKKERHELTGADGGPVQIEEVRAKLLQKFNELGIEEPEEIEKLQEGSDGE